MIPGPWLALAGEVYETSGQDVPSKNCRMIQHDGAISSTQSWTVIPLTKTPSYHEQRPEFIHHECTSTTSTCPMLINTCLECHELERYYIYDIRDLRLALPCYRNWKGDSKPARSMYFISVHLMRQCYQAPYLSSIWRASRHPRVCRRSPETDDSEGCATALLGARISAYTLNARTS